MLTKEQRTLSNWQKAIQAFKNLPLPLSMNLGSIINMGEIKYKKVYQKYSAK